MLYHLIKNEWFTEVNYVKFCYLAPLTNIWQLSNFGSPGHVPSKSYGKSTSAAYPLILILICKLGTYYFFIKRWVSFDWPDFSNMSIANKKIITNLNEPYIWIQNLFVKS